MADWTPNKKIDLTPSGEDLGGFAEKYQEVVENQIFACLNFLRRGGATAGLDDTDAAAYVTRINTTDGCIYIRDGENKEWIFLGRIAPYFGLEAVEIGAIINGGGLDKLTMGLEENLPTTDNKSNDLYFASDTSRVFIWTGAAWKKFLSLNFADMLNYEKYCVSKAEVSETGGKGKIPRLDENTGKGNFDITGSPERIWDYFLDFQELKDGDAIVFNAEKKKWVNLPNTSIDRTAIAEIVKNEFDEKYYDRVVNINVNEAAVSVASQNLLNTLNLDARLENLKETLAAELKEIVDENKGGIVSDVIFIGESRPDNAAIWIKLPAGSGDMTTSNLTTKDMVVGDTMPADGKMWIKTGD